VPQVVRVAHPALDIAVDVGIAHPTILHHFGSREGLVEAVVDRSLRGIQSTVVGALAAAPFDDTDAGALLGLVMRELAERGQARLLAWLALEGRPQIDPARMLRRIAEAMHQKRLAETGRDAPLEGTLFVVVLSALALVGEAILGPAIWDSADLAGDATAPERYHAWLVRLLAENLHTAATPPPPRGRRRRRGS
jgi:AcrR family transcriptional regulator